MILAGNNENCCVVCGIKLPSFCVELLSRSSQSPWSVFCVEPGIWKGSQIDVCQNHPVSIINLKVACYYEKIAQTVMVKENNEISFNSLIFSTRCNRSTGMKLSCVFLMKHVISFVRRVKFPVDCKFNCTHTRFATNFKPICNLILEHKIILLKSECIVLKTQTSRCD